MIDAGALVLWNTRDPGQVLPEKTAGRIVDRLPLLGIMGRVDGPIGLMSYMDSGRKLSIAVRLDELMAVSRS